jgi:tRNA modification GTPase
MTASASAATYLACLTPAGTGAIATLALRGPDAWTLIRELFTARSAGPSGIGASPLPALPECGRLWLGRLGEQARGSGDEVVLVVQRIEPAPWLEIHCHGGREVIRMLEEVFAARGVQVCSWQELEHGTAADPTQAAALAALAEAPTTRTAAILLDQYRGAFSRAVEGIRAALQRNDPEQTTRLLDELTRHAALGRHLTSPWHVVIAGAPNVGKSTLLNALVGYHRSVVTPTAGTTRDVVTTQTAIAGWPVEFADTAGWRETASPLEEQGIALARAAAAAADLCLWVLDAAAEPVWPFGVDKPVLLVINKTDLPSGWDLSRAAGAIPISALTGDGLERLLQALAERLMPEPPAPGAAVPFTAALAGRIEAARQAWHAGKADETRQIVESVWEERR